MKDKRLVIQINKPVSEVFAFTTNPKNTPLWINSIIYEETNEWPVKKETIYRNKNKANKWSEYEVTDFEINKSFIFSQKGTNYHVRYTFTPTPNGGTELEYYEWVDAGEIAEPFTMEIMEKLKTILEA